jgi:hypothetical protein
MPLCRDKITPLLWGRMRWLRLLLLGLASIYPLYWTAQFLLYFFPESAVGYWLGQPVRVISISYLQATAVTHPHPVFPAYWEAIVSACFFSLMILALRGDRFVTGAFSIVVLGQAALSPFLNAFLSPTESRVTVVLGGLAAFLLIVLGLYRILSCTGGADFFDRLALLSLLAVLPQAALWVAFRVAYPYFHTSFLLYLLVPVYLGAIVAALLPTSLSGRSFSNVPWTEIVASSTVAALLLIAIRLSSYSGDIFNSQADDQVILAARVLAGIARGMLT